MYAQLDENNICRVVTNDKVIGVPEIYATVENLGQKYNEKDGTWEAVDLPILAPPPITNEDLIQAIEDFRIDLIIAGVI